MNPESIRRELQKGIEDQVFPGAALLVARHRHILFRGFFGVATLFPQPEPLTDKTLFDIASLTKPVATTTLMMLAVQEKGLDLDAPISQWIKEFETEDKRKITLSHLLKHTSGLPAWRPYFEQCPKNDSKFFYLKKIAQEPLEHSIGSRRNYSDLGFVILGFFLETFYQKSLDELFLQKIAGPLNLTHTFFLRRGETKADVPFAATDDSQWRKKLIRGEVHDDNAYALGGVAGHAGLFSTVDDLHLFLSSIRQACKGEHSLLSKGIIQRFVGADQEIKLGWDQPSPQDSQAGRFFSKNSIGHLGYSGCSFWMDLDRDFHVILLTNRIHPTCKNEKIKVFRPLIHDLIYRELIHP